MTKEGKNLKIIGLRPSKGGDLITSLPVLHLLEKKYPNSYKTVSVAKKNSVFAQLLYNHPLIDRIHINEILENSNKEDIDFILLNLDKKEINELQWNCYQDYSPEKVIKKFEEVYLQ